MEKNNNRTLMDEINDIIENSDFSYLITHLGENGIDKTISDIETVIDEIQDKTL